MKIQIALIASIGVLMVPLVCFAGPFGFTYGESRQAAVASVGTSHVMKGGDEYTVKLDAAPMPHPGFESYSLIFSPTKVF